MKHFHLLFFSLHEFFDILKVLLSFLLSQLYSLLVIFLNTLKVFLVFFFELLYLFV